MIIQKKEQKIGHTAPIITIPYGDIAEIDCDKKKFSILDAGVC